MLLTFTDSMMAFSRTSQNIEIFLRISAEIRSSQRVTMIFGLIPKDINSL